MKPLIVLRIFKDSALIEVKQFDRFPIIVGKPEAEVDLFLDDQSISLIHCLFDQRGDKYFICDLGSQIGTFKNGKKILDEELFNQDVVSIGNFKIEVFIPSLIPQVIPQVNQVKKEFQNLSKNSVKNIEVPTIQKQNIESINSDSLLSSSFSKKNVTNYRKKVTFAPKSEFNDLKDYLRFSSGNSVQFIIAWKERILNIKTYNLDYKFLTWANVFSRYFRAENLNINSKTLSFQRGKDQVISIFIPHSFEVNLMTQTVSFDGNHLKSLNRLRPISIGYVFNINDGEILQLKNDKLGILIYVRLVGPTNKIRPLGYLDVSSQEITSILVSAILVALIALYITITHSEPIKGNITDELRFAQFVYTSVPKEEPSIQHHLTEKEILENTSDEFIKKEVVVEKPPVKIEEKLNISTPQKHEESQGIIKSNIVKKAKEEGEGKGGKNINKNQIAASEPDAGGKKSLGGLNIGNKDASNATSKKVDVSEQGLLSAFSGGGVRSRLDQVYSGSGELIGKAQTTKSSSGSKEYNFNDDLGGQLKGDGTGKKGFLTKQIGSIITKGRSSGQYGYGAVEGPGLGKKGRIIVDLPGGTSESFSGSIDREAVRRVIRSIINQIKSCYERRLYLKPGLSGKIVILFEIGSGGKVIVSRPKSSTVDDVEVGICVAQRIKEQRFPEPARGTIAVVEYPFVFDAQR